ncbi:DUF5790 family protein [Halobacteria archaeon AArc-dxtr1]|nr:DUF5790 family protein [Halobacteria archaeon AArc-dxtr1]
MSQASLDDDDLFGEAASEMRADVEDSLAAAWAELPEPDDVWESDADNVLGTLNGLKSALDAADAEDNLRDAKKWYTMGERADAFEDAADLESEIEDVESAIADIEAAGEQVSELTATIPALRGTLAESGPDDEDAEAEEETGVEAEAETEAEAEE